MSLEWQFADVEHLFREHAASKDVDYNPNRPLAALDKDAIKRASELLGAQTWADFAEIATQSKRTVEKWSTDATRPTFENTIFPALCEVAAKPYKEHREAYQNSGAWLARYVEEKAAFALINRTETPEDAAEELREAWERYNVATLLFAAFRLTGDELETVANSARYALAASPSGVRMRTNKPRPCGDPFKDQREAAQIKSEAEAIEHEAAYSIPERSVCSIDFCELKSIVDERASAIRAPRAAFGS